MSAEPKRKAIL